MTVAELRPSEDVESALALLLNLVDRDVSTSIETGFQMFLTAAAIVFGLLVADVVGARSRR
jgi:uncharacterized membrane protein YjjB (DUF3815 family)